MKTQLDNKSKGNKKLSEEVMKVTEEMERTKDSETSDAIHGQQAANLHWRSTTCASI